MGNQSINEKCDGYLLIAMSRMGYSAKTEWESLTDDNKKLSAKIAMTIQAQEATENLASENASLKSLLDECRQALEQARDFYTKGGTAWIAVNTLLDKIGGVV